MDKGTKLGWMDVFYCNSYWPPDISPPQGPEAHPVPRPELCVKGLPKVCSATAKLSPFLGLELPFQ